MGNALKIKNKQFYIKITISVNDKTKGDKLPFYEWLSYIKPVKMYHYKYNIS